MHPPAGPGARQALDAATAAERARTIPITCGSGGRASGHRPRRVVARGCGDGTGEGEGEAERSSVEQLKHQPERSTASDEGDATWNTPALCGPAGEEAARVPWVG